MQRNRRGFTLVEILVVICILGILMALLVPTLVGAKGRAIVTQCKAEISQLKSSLETYNSKFGDYPPSSPAALGASLAPDDVNQGNEAMVACLATRKGSGPFFTFPENRLQNRDNDSTPKNLTDWIFGDNQLFEFEDNWGNPYVYMHSRDYERPTGINRVLTQHGTEAFEVTPMRSEKTKSFINPVSFQIWSLGPDHESQNGLEDDVVDQ